ncbi:MAG: family 20 glycosylhydrolase [Aliidongia sp.]
MLDPGLALPGFAEQGYMLEIGAAGVRIAGRTAQGVFHGIQSVLHLLPVAAWRAPQPSLTLPFCRVTDAPAFAYRGQHFDVARNFSDKRMVLRLIDLLALYKMNALHLHLTDDEGWRLEMPSLPELTAYGSVRGFSPGERDCLQPSFGSGPERSHGPGSGSFSQKDFVEILRYAKARHIEVIPEIDLPAMPAPRSRRWPHGMTGCSPRASRQRPRRICCTIGTTSRIMNRSRPGTTTSSASAGSPATASSRRWSAIWRMPIARPVSR